MANRCGYDLRSSADTWENRQRALWAGDRAEHERLDRKYRLREPKPDTSGERIHNRTFAR